VALYRFDNRQTTSEPTGTAIKQFWTLYSARRSVIENVYKKVNGTLEGLDDKIGPGFSSAAPTPTVSPTP